MTFKVILVCLCDVFNQNYVIILCAVITHSITVTVKFGYNKHGWNWDSLLIKQ